MDTPTLMERWAALREAEPRMRVRDAAATLGCTEAELVSLDGSVVRLRNDWPALFRGISAAGEVMALTRNAACVHERHGSYGAAQLSRHVGLVLGEEIDLRLFLNRWRHAFFVPAGQPGSPRGSVQVFDAAGTAVHKVFVTEATRPHGFAPLVAELAEAPRPVAPVPDAPDAARGDDQVDAEGLRTAWRALRDTHDFFPLLRRFGAGRQQALRLAGDDLARRVAIGAIGDAITEAARTGLPIMVFVGNPGCLQIHTGPVTNIKVMGPWFNVLDPRFNLHLRQDAVDQVWLVRKPTDDGVVTSLEAFDADGALIVTLFGRRKPGVPEDGGWRALAEGFAS
jgi:putative hemin transport protein